jgi:hypothetical protein
MKLENLKFGMRLGAIFELLLMPMVMLIVVGLARLTSLVEINDSIIHTHSARGLYCLQ